MEATQFKKIHIQTLEFKVGNHSKPHENFYPESLWDLGGTKKLLTYEENCKVSMRAKFNNGFFAAFVEAYNCHGDVKITPDDVWLTIMLYFSKYVNNNAEQLRSAFVTHKGKKKLSVVTHN